MTRWAWVLFDGPDISGVFASRRKAMADAGFPSVTTWHEDDPLEYRRDDWTIQGWAIR